MIKVKENSKYVWKIELRYELTGVSISGVCWVCTIAVSGIVLGWGHGDGGEQADCDLEKQCNGLEYCTNRINEKKKETNNLRRKLIRELIGELIRELI